MIAGSVIEPTPMRAAIARRMSESKREVPHFYVQASVDVGAVQQLVKRHNAQAGDVRVTLTAALAVACTKALRECPEFNRVWTPEGLTQVEPVNLGLAIAVGDGLIAPAILGAERLGLTEMAEAISDLVSRAGSGALRPSEMMDATFTLSNLGMYDVSAFVAIVVPPQVGILATARPMSQLHLGDGGQPESRQIMTVTLSADHRAVDGVNAARFLQSLKTALEAPLSLATAFEVR